MMDPDTFLKKLSSLRGEGDVVVSVAAMLDLEVTRRGSGLTPLDLLALSVNYAKVGAYDQARRCAHALAQAAPGIDGIDHAAVQAAINLYAGYAQHDDQTLALVYKAARRVLTEDRQNVFAAACVGALLVQQGRWRLLARLRRAFLAKPLEGEGNGQFLRAAINMISPEVIDAPIPAPILDAGARAPDCNAAANGKKPPVIVFACDEVYWRAFSERTIASLLRANPDATIHVHVVFPGPECLEALQAKKRAHQHSFNFSYEMDHPGHGVSQLPGDRKKVYYACSRFIVAGRLLDYYRRPLILLDVDAVFQRPLGTLIRDLREGHVALIHRPNSSPLYEVAAGFLYLDHSDVAASFISDVSSYIVQKISQGHGYWFLDQIALYLTYLRYSQQGVRIRRETFMRVGQMIHFAGIYVGANTVSAKLADLDRLG